MCCKGGCQSFDWDSSVERVFAAGAFVREMLTVPRSDIAPLSSNWSYVKIKSAVALLDPGGGDLCVGGTDPSKSVHFCDWTFLVREFPCLGNEAYLRSSRAAAQDGSIGLDVVLTILSS